MNFEKSLSHSEAKYKYLGLPKKDRGQFPEKDQIFEMKFKGKSFNMKVNNKDSIMISHLYDVHQFQEGELIKIIKKKDTYLLSVE